MQERERNAEWSLHSYASKRKGYELSSSEVSTHTQEREKDAGQSSHAYTKRKGYEPSSSRVSVHELHESRVCKHAQDILNDI